MQELQAHFDALSVRGPLPSDIRRRVGPYRSYAQWMAELLSWVEAGAKPHCIGRSLEGRPLFAFELGDLGRSRHRLVLGCVHAMEWIGVEVVRGIVQAWLALPNAPPLLVVPIVNPDGFCQVEDDLRQNRRRFRRGNAHNVDLNRNWPTFHRAHHARNRFLPLLGTPGPGPGSEPEVHSILQALDGLLDGDSLERAVSLHSFGNMILTPFGGQWRRPKAHRRLRTAAKQVQAASLDRYKIRQSSHWVPGAFAYGMEIDHLHHHYGADALLVECPGGLDLQQPATWLHPFRWFNTPTPDSAVAALAPSLVAWLLGDAPPI